MGLKVDADISDSEDLFGKTVDDLQSDIRVWASSISGTLKYIADYSDAGYTGDEQSGNFIVLHAEVPDVEDVTITAELLNGVHGPVTLDSDGLCIFRVADKISQSIKFVARKTGYEPFTRTFTINGLTVEQS